MSSPAEDEDDELLTRLNALKPSSVTFKRTTDLGTPLLHLSGSSHEREPDDIAARFAKLHGRKSAEHANVIPAEPVHVSEFNHDIEDDRTLDELIQEIEGDKGWELDVNKEEESRKLLQHAQNTLAESRGNSDRTTDTRSADGDGRGKQLDGQSEEEEAHRYIRKALEEASLEGDENHSETNEALEENPSEKDNSNLDLDSSLLPTVPKTLPVTNPAISTGAPVEQTYLPDAPTSKPTSKVSQSKNVEKFTDEEIDTWCIICNDDATVRCLGCDGDLYCASCWEEGHNGEDAGYDEKMHRAVRFVKKNPEKKLKRLIVG